MVKISDKSDYSRFVRPADEDEGSGSTTSRSTSSPIPSVR
jgi:hypothetical protein